MQKRLIVGALWTWILVGVPAANAQTAPDILACEMAPDTIAARFVSKNHYQIQMGHYRRLADGSRGELVGIETFWNPSLEKKGDEKLIKRELYTLNPLYPKRTSFPELLHGVTREWYPNGQLKSERPYRMGVMDGLFRYFDESGQLVGQYQMKDGTGVARIYTSQGQLQKEKHYQNGRENGLRFDFGPPSRYDFWWEKEGSMTGTSFGYSGRRVAHLSFWNEKGVLHGPLLRFDLRTEQDKKRWVVDGFGIAGDEKKWYVSGKSVSAEEYAQAAAQDPTLLPYFEDIEQYQGNVTPEMKALAEKYRTRLRVRIPLEFDANEEPLPAPPEMLAAWAMAPLKEPVEDWTF